MHTRTRLFKHDVDTGKMTLQGMQSNNSIMSIKLKCQPPHLLSGTLISHSQKIQKFNYLLVELKRRQKQLNTDKRATVSVQYTVVFITRTSAYTLMCMVSLSMPVATWVTWTPTPTTIRVKRMPLSIMTGNTALYGRTNKDITN